tara:strand:+ start:3296 stop:3463 length:168 start_codon:yes stop_codon:yes gene_type:complete
MPNMTKKDYNSINFSNKDIDKLSLKQMKIAKLTSPFNKITGSDLKALRNKKNKNA